MKPIRVGLIRCDLHAYWYMPFIADPVPEIMHQQYSENYWLFYGNYTCQPRKLIIPRVQGYELAKVWDPDRKTAEIMSQAFHGKPEVCDSREEVYDDVDLLFISDCFGQGEDHLEFAAPALERGLPTFVDKPFAYTLKDAQSMVDLALKHDTPLLSTSLLGISPHADRFRNRFAEIAPIIHGTVRAPIGEQGNLAGGYHIIALMQNLFGTGVEWVDCMGDRPLEILRLHYPNGVEAIGISSFTYGEDVYCGYQANVYGRKGVVHSPFIDDFAFPASGERIFNLIKEMLATGKPPVSYESMLELMQIIEAGRLAQKLHRKVYLNEISALIESEAVLLNQEAGNELD